MPTIIARPAATISEGAAGASAASSDGRLRSESMMFVSTKPGQSTDALILASRALRSRTSTSLSASTPCFVTP